MKVNPAPSPSTQKVPQTLTPPPTGAPPQGAGGTKAGAPAQGAVSTKARKPPPKADTYTSAQPKGTGPKLHGNSEPSSAAEPRAAGPEETVAHLGDEPVNEAAEEQAQQGWKQTTDAVKQSSATGCGEASLAYLEKADGHKPGKTDEQIKQEVRKSTSELNGMKTVRRRVPLNLSNGATPAEMGAALGGMGMRVVRGLGNYDAHFMSDAIGKGQFGLALLDSNALANANLPPGKQKTGPGKLHWVTLDGIDTGADRNDRMDDKFRVKDPANGEYWLTARELENAIEKSRQHHGSGGVLAVETLPDVDTRAEREQLALANLNHTGVLGKGNGIGSSRFTGSDPGYMK